MVADTAEAAELYIARGSLLDAADLVRLRTASLEEMGVLSPAERPSFVQRAQREFVQLLREERMAAWVLVASSRAVGCACVLLWQRIPYPKSSVHAEISGVYVDPAYRGRGYAREMVQEAISWARGAQARRIVLHAGPKSRTLYQRLGFVDGSEMRLP
ncbi:MAG: GNAT family N-acetyltransferase [bacterium]|nr:GNAT family N-acetyltransferase [bacterium]